MSAINVLISNGTCYYAAGRKASSNIIPCGNAANGAQQCCQEGDFCLEYNVCFNANYTTTYLAGCTDEDFTSPNCPGKGTSEQQLLNLVQCADSESGGSVVWSACSAATTRTEIGPPAACTCTNSDNGILTGPKSFSPVASLPTTIGETISFQSGHTPKTKGIATATSTATDGQLTTMTTPIATSSATASSTVAEDSGLSKGAKAGIGVGVAAVAAGVLALIAFLFVRYRRNHTKKPAEEVAYHPTAPGPEMAQSPPPQYGSPSSPYGSPGATGAPAVGYTGYTGFKSELPAVPVESKSAFTYELPAGNNAHSSVHGFHRNATVSMLSMPGSPGHLSMVSDISRAPSVAPSDHSNQSDGYTRGPVGGNMTPIAELHG
ncbi:hypothetical protein J7T55_013703 [Diaporthe amygdali]|uniref:uncharacterized protein n=1 Tax=Phomopsis amygdali TaxID=1214568 RepID=UPI0022FE3837|nr:uncharacterized protein J7T55_013703 [Diaporthe amygdali]KAJ0119501.1 hypothetical protein J7T55_013703 [Diaporthe amygdali]